MHTVYMNKLRLVASKYNLLNQEHLTEVSRVGQHKFRLSFSSCLASRRSECQDYDKVNQRQSARGRFWRSSQLHTTPPSAMMTVNTGSKRGLIFTDNPERPCTYFVFRLHHFQNPASQQRHVDKCDVSSPSYCELNYSAMQPSDMEFKQSQLNLLLLHCLVLLVNVTQKKKNPPFNIDICI